jgi:hypothetical protein
MYHGASAFDH